MEDKYYMVSVEDTIKYGITAAAIIGRVRWWCEYNQKNKVKDRYHMNFWWSGFMSYNEFSTQLGIPLKTIEKHLPKLVKSGILIADKFNKKKYDKTNWYRVNPSPQIEDTLPPNRGNGYTQIEDMDTPKLGKPIPVILSVNQNVKQTVNPPVKPFDELTPEERNELLKIEYQQKQELKQLNKN